MEVIVHQHEGVHLDSMLPASAMQEVTKVMSIIIVQEDGASVYAALCHVQRNAR
jgi:hypothetical protein